MRSTLARLTASVAVISIVTACAPTPIASPSSTASTVSSSAAAPSAAASAPSVVVSPGPSTATVTQPSDLPSQTSALPIRGSARELALQIQLAPGLNGSLLLTIPTPGGSVLAILDQSGQPRQGWPITVTGATPCSQLHPISDGSVRVVCTMVRPDGSVVSPTGIFAFDPTGRMLPGWPIALDGSTLVARGIGDELTMFASWSLVDNDDGEPSNAFGLVTIAYTGEVRNGTRVPMFCCAGIPSIGPNGVASAVTDISGEGSELTSQITALDQSGVLAGWPPNVVGGIAATPAVGADGRTFVAVGTPSLPTSDVFALTHDGHGYAGTTIPMSIVDEAWGDTGGCSASPRQPLVANDSTIVFFSETDDTMVALQPSLEPKPGWPWTPSQPLVRRDERYVKEDAYCPSIAIPAVGSDGSLYLPLQARSATVGGSLVAVNPDGRLRRGWPVELRRAGSEFWSVVVGPDGTAYALAIEPESSRTSSASIVAIAPDSTVRYSTTIIEP